MNTVNLIAKSIHAPFSQSQVGMIGKDRRLHQG